MLIVEGEWQRWKQDDVTGEFFKALKKKREEMKENLANDIYENDDVVKGKLMALSEVLGMTYQDLQEMIHDQ